MGGPDDHFPVLGHGGGGVAPDPGHRFLEGRAAHVVKGPIKLGGPGPLYIRHLKACFLFSVLLFLTFNFQQSVFSFFLSSSFFF
jgi:hypothetical protein